MDKKRTLPLCLIRELESLNICNKDIVSSAYVDMNTNCEFVKSYLILTNKFFIMAEGKLNKDNVFVFGDVKDYEQTSLNEKFDIRLFHVNEIREMKISTELHTGLLYLVGKKTELICYFTIGRHAEVLQLVTDFRRMYSKDDKSDSFNENREVKKPPINEDMPCFEGKNKEMVKHQKSIIRRLLCYLKPHKLKLLILLFSYLAIACCNLVWPYLSGTVLYDWVLTKKPEIIELLGLESGEFLLALGIVVLGMIAAKVLILGFTTLNSYINTHMNQNIIMDMRNDVFESMGSLSLRYFQSSQTGTLMVRVLQDASRVSRLLVDEMPNFLINMFTIITTVIVMLSINVKLAFISFIPLPLILYISAKIRPRMFVLFGKRHRAERRMTTSINDSITGIRVVKVFGKENEEVKKFSEVNEDVKNVEREITVFSSKLNAVNWILNELATLIIWGVGAYIILSGKNLSYGVLLTFVGYVAQLNRPLEDLIRMFRQWVDSMNASERLFEIIDAKPDIENKGSALELKNPKGHISLEHVSFGYEPNIPVLKDLSLEVKPGQTLGIVGRSGAGKTTLVNVISRLYEIEKGSIKIDGIDIRDISLESLRKGIAMVSQETYIFMGTIAENISYARPDASREEIIKAAVFASAHDFICNLPEGYDTIIGTAGRSLSGGERQRISIARAVLADPKILILDEATASVDTKTEQAIQEALTRLSENRTTLSIAHRLSTLKNADYLVVIEHGRIIEEGTHEELMKKNGTYCMLKELQTNALALKGLE